MAHYWLIENDTSRLRINSSWKPLLTLSPPLLEQSAELARRLLHQPLALAHLLLQASMPLRQQLALFAESLPLVLLLRGPSLRLPFHLRSLCHELLRKQSQVEHRRP
jgi:hypothetical protein